jgi:hypothetical protein
VKTCSECGAPVDLGDLLTLLEIIREAVMADSPHLAVTVLTLLIEHKTELGLRAQRLRDLLAEQ